MKKIIIYIKATCSKSRETIKQLEESGIPFEVVNYYETPLSAEKLLELAGKIGVPVSDMLRTKEAIYKELRLGEKDLSDRELAEIMVSNPDLIERPIVEMGETAMITRVPEKMREVIEWCKSNVAE